MIGFDPRDLITVAQYRRMIREEQDAGDRVHLLHSIRGSEEGPKFIYENDLDTAPMDRAAAAFGNAVSLGAAPPRFAPGPRRTAPGRPGPRGQGLVGTNRVRYEERPAEKRTGPAFGA